VSLGVSGTAVALIIRATLSGVLVAIIALVSRRSPGVGGLIASLPLVSVLGMVWLWRDTGDREALATYIGSAFWYFLPTIPMFIFMPPMLRAGVNVWVTLGIGIAVTMLLYVVMNRALAAFGITL
jgi:flagellar biosynthesis protein FliR